MHRENSYFCDASFLIALFAKRDREHPKAMRIIRKLAPSHPILLTMWPLISEATTILLYHYGFTCASLFLRSLSEYQILLPLQEEYQTVLELFPKYCKDKTISFNDLLCLSVIRNRFKDLSVISFDEDFAKMGLTIYRGTSAT